VHDAAGVCVAHGLGDPRQRVHQPLEGPPGRRLPHPVGAPDRVQLLDGLGEGAAADLLHREPRPPVGVLPELVDRGDAGVLQLGGDPGLVEEQGPRPAVGGELRVQLLAGHDAPEVVVVDRPDLAHPAHAERPAQRVPGAGREREHGGLDPAHDLLVAGGARRVPAEVPQRDPEVLAPHRVRVDGLPGRGGVGADHAREERGPEAGRVLQVRPPRAQRRRVEVEHAGDRAVVGQHQVVEVQVAVHCDLGR
jgi:hypothetical protein